MSRPSQVCERELKDRTQSYWRLLEKLDSLDKLMETLEWYVDHLLPGEMECFRCHSPKPERVCHTLALLVGYSLEPLLQTICFYQPQRILLVLSENYGSTVGDVMGGHIERLVNRLAAQGLLTDLPAIGPKDDEDYFCEVKSNPAHVFRLLLRELESEPPEDVVVDITGARKSMVAGAFFYAAFAGVAISYVEFDDTHYNLVLGRPEGYRSVIRRLPNPYTAFALREWWRVRHLYTHYDFRSARESLIQDVLPGMAKLAPDSDQPFFKPEQIRAVKQLIKVLEFYERWDRGDFRHAAAKPTCLSAEQQPLAVRLLADLLPDQLDRQSGKRAADQLVSHLNKQMLLDCDDRSFLLKPKLLGVYAADEIARIERLIRLHQDYRSALMRATGLYELLLHARILTLWRLGKLEFCVVDGDATWKLLTSDLFIWREGYSSLVRMQGLDSYERFAYEHAPYSRGDAVCVRWPDGNEWEIPPTARLPTSIRELRHKTTHRAVAVPEASAKLALETVRASFDNYHDQWAPHLGPDLHLPDPDAPEYQARPWSVICELCGLRGVLPPNLLQDEGRD